MKLRKWKFFVSLSVLLVLSTGARGRQTLDREPEEYNRADSSRGLERQDDEQYTRRSPQERNLTQKKSVKKRKAKNKKNSHKLVKKGKHKGTRKLSIKEKKVIKKFQRALKQYHQKHKEPPKKEAIKKLIKSVDPKHERVLFWWWWRRHQAHLARIRRHKNNIRRELSKRENNFKIKAQKQKIRELDRNNFDKLMDRERKKDAELWTRTFLYDAVLLTEKLLYIEHEKLYKEQMKLAVENETAEVSKIGTYFSKHAGKKRSELTPAEVEEDIFN